MDEIGDGLGVSNELLPEVKRWKVSTDAHSFNPKSSGRGIFSVYYTDKRTAR